MDLLNKSADDCLNAGEGINFEHKIVMSIAIRILAERFMVQKINDDAFVESIDGFQTFALFDEFRKKLNPDSETLEILQGVLLMTPESIHLNAFMYEPIIDMSDSHLRRLLTKVKALNV